MQASRFQKASIGVTACRNHVILVFGLVLVAYVSPLDAQQTPSLFGGAQTEQVAPPLPPEGSPTLLRAVELRFPTQGNVASVEFDTYLFHMRIRDFVSLPSEGRWVPYSEATEQVAIEDHRRLWDTGFLNDLWIEVIDDPYPNGVEAKRIIYNLEERERVKIITYEGSDELKTEDILLNMEEQNVTLRLDTFLDPATIRRVEGVIRFLFAAKGYMFAEVDTTVEPVAGGPNLVKLTFQMDEGPKVQVEEIDFIGNVEMTDGSLKRRMQNVKERYWLSFLTGRGAYKPEEYEEDAERVEAYYRDEGYITAQIGQPDIEYLELSEDGESRGMRLVIPVDEGERYRMGEIDFEGSEVLLEEGLRRIFDDLTPGDYYSESDIREGFQDARELYGSLGYFEMTIAPDLKPRDDVVEVNSDDVDESDSDEFSTVSNDRGSEFDEGDGFIDDDDRFSGLEEEPALEEVRPTHIDGSPVVDVTIRVQEGEQYRLNRIEFTGNDVTHDEVIRRELQIVENSVFNTEALRRSVRRLNQLGFFEPFEENEVDVEKVETGENEVNIRLDLTEANLNQLSFGAGVSQFDGFFGQVSFSTSNFMGRGETLGVSMMSGMRARNHTVSFTRPFNFGRPLSLGTQVYSRKIEWIGSFTEETTGGSVTVGYPLSFFTRVYLSYSLEQAFVGDINPYFESNPALLSYNPFLSDALLLGTGGRRNISKITPSITNNTVDHPIFPTTGKNFTAAAELAGAGGNTRFVKPRLEATMYKRHTAKTIFGMRVQGEFLVASSPESIPIFERLWLGGEYSVRGFDIRRIGPTLADTNPDVGTDTYQGRTIMGGNKSLLVNLEYQFVINDNIRIVAFFDAGEVQDWGQEFAIDDVKTSTGAELRFFMPMLNVPFRLIYYFNPMREGVYNDRLYRQEGRGFRFAMGTTF